MHYLGGLSVTTKILLSERVKKESEHLRDGRRERQRTGSLLTEDRKGL